MRDGGRAGLAWLPCSVNNDVKGSSSVRHCCGPWRAPVPTKDGSTWSQCEGGGSKGGRVRAEPGREGDG